MKVKCDHRSKFSNLSYCKFSKICCLIFHETVSRNIVRDICTAVWDEKFSNLSNWKEEAWKNQGFNGIRTHDLRDTGAMLYQLSYEATHWEQGQFIEFISSRAVNLCEIYMK